MVHLLNLRISVLSGVPQGTVLGPLMFLLYINDITDKVSSTLHLFADDCILYKSPEDSISLQKDLDLLSHWPSTWQMNFNTSICVVLRCSRSPMPILYNYHLNDHVLDIREEHPTWALYYINHYPGPVTYQKYPQKPHRHLISYRETLVNVHLPSKLQLSSMSNHGICSGPLPAKQHQCS